ncbi:hypothetical protein [Flavobacterium litorale]|uniref:Uncharacterized protein n=1 Tax=Flavobacterium litorale TaxID=2856519 RepID=A0ABX8V7V1_9FLAO|nr:hypothetical protein [Flavobacterium litorale]QYJ68925.1 hypothetical protein K1I41_03305 [Flavobacterium litorale]
MSELLLYVNGQLVDLDPNQHIAQTKQINNLNSLSNRQSNYTNRFKLPKTAKNLQLLQFLAVTGNNSTAPYQQNQCSLYSKSGECFVYNGYATVTDGGKYFNVVLYDGIIDLEKVIENKTFADVDISALNHEKNIATITQNWQNTSSPYRYIVADYGGNTGNTGIGEINIDFLVPSVKAAYLWEQIQAAFGLTFNGTIFQTEYFQNLWMTFPKGISTEDQAPIVYQCTDNDFAEHNSNYYIKCNTADINEYEFADDEQYHLRIPETGTYRIDVSGNIVAGSLYGSVPLRVFYGRNVQGVAAANVTAYTYNVLGSNLQSNTSFALQPMLVNLNANDTLALLVDSTAQYPIFINNGSSAISVTITKLDATTISFTDSLSAFGIKDFLKEIVHRFGLTMVKSTNNNHYHFYTFDEQLQIAPTANWSEKYLSTDNEKYVYGSYAQQNYFRYQYNDTESDYNDSYIGINNANIKPQRDVIKSKIYSPEQRAVTYLNEAFNQYKLWDKEVDDEGAVTYKALDKRFYFLRSDTVSHTDLAFAAPFNIMSNRLPETATATTVYRESFWRLSFGEILQDFYSPISRILNQSVIVNAQMWLTETDVANFNFIQLYYIEQLGGYFIVNKINNYIPNKPTKVELIRVIYGNAPALLSNYQEIRINNVTALENDFYYVEYEASYIPQSGTAFRFESSSNGTNWIDIDNGISGNIGEATATINLADYASGYLRIRDNVASVTSNAYQLKQITIGNAIPSGNDYNVFYTLSYTPDYTDVFNFEISENGTSWNSTDFGISQNYIGTNPILLENLNTYTGGYIRLVDVSSGVTSNAYNFRKITIANVQNAGANLYTLTYNANYTPATGVFFRIEVTNNGYTWVDIDDYTGSYNGSITVNLTDFTTATHIRITDNTYAISSNAFLL